MIPLLTHDSWYQPSPMVPLPLTVMPLAIVTVCEALGYWLEYSPVLLSTMVALPEDVWMLGVLVPL